MELLAIEKEDLPGFVDALAAGFELVGPRPKESRYVFRRAGSYGELAAAHDSTLLPPKDCLMPRVEPLFRYELGERVVLNPAVDESRRVIFGMHACDINGMWLLDDVMAEGIPDTNYIARRSNTYVVGLDCSGPCFDNSFCGSMKTYRPAGGYDLFLTDLGDVYAVQTGSRRAGELTGMGCFFPAGYRIRERFLGVWASRDAVFGDRLGYDGSLIPGLLAGAYESGIWDELAERCFDCGACTVVCPTCYCFDVFDVPDLDLGGGTRYRRWDGCQLRRFAAVAGGGNFRGERSDRIRHRLMRKGRYFKEKFGRFACVGCGRCGRACLAEIDVLEIFRRIKA